MPITITAPISGGPVGPGFTIQGSTDLIGPLPVDSHWHYQVLGGPSSEDPIIGWDQDLGSGDQHFFTMTIGSEANVLQLQPPAIPLGSPVRVVVELRRGIFDPVVDQGSIPAVWDPVSYVWTRPTSATGGFNDQDRAQLAAVNQRTQLLGELGDLVLNTPSGPVQTTVAQLLSRQTLDTLTLSELTSGETFDPVRVTFNEHYFGIIVRTTTIAEGMTPKTPDDDWYFPDLAVLRIFRGGDLEERHGIHTPTYMQYRPFAWFWVFLNSIPVLGQAADRTIAVDWRAGCGGQVYLMRFP